MEIFGVTDWLFWLVLAFALLGIELLVAFTFIAGPVGIAAGGASLTAALGGSIELQLVVFIAVSLLTLLFVRPIARDHLTVPPDIATNVNALVGRRAIVLEKVDLDEGKVRIGDDIWTARTQSEDIVLMPGDRAVVTEVRGVHAFVEPATT